MRPCPVRLLPPHTPTEEAYHSAARLQWRLHSPGAGEGLIMHPIRRSGACWWKPGLDNNAWTLGFHLKPNDEFTFQLHFPSALQHVVLFLPHWWRATKLQTKRLRCICEMSHPKSSFSSRSSTFITFFTPPALSSLVFSVWNFTLALPVEMDPCVMAKAWADPMNAEHVRLKSCY